MESADLQKEIEELRGDLANLRKDVAELVDTLVEFGKAGSGVAADKAQAEARRRLGQLSESCAAVRERGSQATGRLKSCIEERPLASVAAALGVGVAFGKLLSRS